MRIEPLLSFCAIVEHGSFSRAADVLYLSQPAVSMNIKQLEKEYGQPLFIRKGRREFTLTPLGEKLYELTCDLRTRLEKLEQLKQDSLRQTKYEIIIDGNSSGGIYLLTLHSAKFQEENPNIHISITQTKTEHAIQNVLNGKTDLVLLLSPATHPLLQPIVSWEDKLEIIVPPNNSLSNQYLTTADLAKQPLILSPKGSPSRLIIDELFRKQIGSPANFMLELGNPEAIKQTVLSLNKPGVVLRYTIQNELDAGTLATVKTELNMSCQHVLFCKRNCSLSDSLRKFTTFLNELVFL